MQEINWGARGKDLINSTEGELKSAVEGWTNHHWSLLMSIFELDPKTRKEFGQRIEGVVQRLQETGINSENSTTKLPFLNMCLRLPQETLDKLVSLAPEDWQTKSP